MQSSFWDRLTILVLASGMAGLTVGAYYHNKTTKTMIEHQTLIDQKFRELEQEHRNFKKTVDIMEDCLQQLQDLELKRQGREGRERLRAILRATAQPLPAWLGEQEPPDQPRLNLVQRAGIMRLLQGLRGIGETHDLLKKFPDNDILQDLLREKRDAEEIIGPLQGLPPSVWPWHEQRHKR
jgi:hypothetical protein